MHIRDLDEPTHAELVRASLAAPAQLDAEVLSAIGRLARAATVTEEAAEHALVQLRSAPVQVECGS